MAALKRFLLGKPLSSHDEQHQRLSKTIALPVFASDAISSTAYATEEILFVIFPVAAFASQRYLVPIAWLVIVLLALVATMGVCTLLGMGVPVPSAYVITAVLAGPPLASLGIDTLTSHLFVLYYASLSAITPPAA